MNMPINLLEALIAIAENPTLARAADVLNLTQPALSMQLKRLEEQFELPLFEFQGKKKVLTIYGKSIYAEAKRLTQEFSMAFEQVNRQYLDGSKLSLRIGGRRELLSKAQKAVQFDGKVTLTAMTSGEAIQALENRRIDLAISRIKPNSSDLIAKKFFTNCPWLVTHKKWVKGRAHGRLSVDKDFLMNTPLIVYTESGDLMSEWLAHVGLSLDQLKIKYVCEDWLTILQMIESGEGYAIIPDSIESNLEQVVHVELPCAVVESVTYYFLYHKSLTKLPPYKHLLQ